MVSRSAIVIATIVLCVYGCGSPEHLASDAGAVAFSVAWVDAPTLSPGFKQGPSFAPIDCVGAGVSTVSAFAYNASDALLASGGPWNCSAHSGTITNIPPQANVKVVVLAMDASNDILYRGEQTGLTINAGQITSAGTITASPFQPALTSPTNGSTVSYGISFNFTWTNTGISYRIQVSTDIGFASTVIDASVTPTQYPSGSMSAGTYYWRVRSFDDHSKASAWSAINRFDIISPKTITAFSFLSPAATGIIDENAKTIAVTVPYGTNVNALIATFSTTGASVRVGATVQVSGTTPNDFTNPVSYVVTATDSSTATYTVTVTVAPNTAKAITAFLFTNPSATGTIDENARTIAVTVPYSANVAALIATFSTTGASVAVGATVQVSGTTPNDFTNPVLYVVTAADSSTATYTVTVTKVKEIYIANSESDSICVFDSQANGNASNLRYFGSFTGLGAPYGIAVDRVNNEIFVVNGASHSITVYGRTASGNITPVRTIAGASTGLISPAGIAVDTINNEIFVTNDVQNPYYSISVYSRTANGNATPLRTITGPNTGFSGSFLRVIAVDTINNELAVIGQITPGWDAIMVFSRTASGNVAPLRTIAGANTGMSSPAGIALDTINNEIVVANNGNSAITVFARTANGDAVPLRTISDTGGPYGIALDTANNEIVVTAYYPATKITVYSRTASGSATPLRTIAGASTGLSWPWGVVADATNNEILVTDVNDNSIKVYVRTANGDVPPLRTISSTAPGLRRPYGIALDAMNNEIFVANYLNNSVTVYGRTANGSVTPLRTISGASTGLEQPVGVAVDTANNEIFVANMAFTSLAIKVYSRTANGNVTPVRSFGSGNATNGVALDAINDEIFMTDRNSNSIKVFSRTANATVTTLRTISGVGTGLSGPYGIAVDTTNNEIFVANTSNNSITVYNRTADGNATPLRTISGLYLPAGIAVDKVNNELFVTTLFTNSIRVYGRTANGNASPVRTISGVSTGLVYPSAVAVW